GKLYDPRTMRRPCNQAKCAAIGRIAAGDIRIRVAAPGAVEHVKEVRTCLHHETLADAGVLDKSEVFTLEAGTANIRKETRRGTKVKREPIVGCQRRVNKCGRIEVRRAVRHVQSPERNRLLDPSDHVSANAASIAVGTAVESRAKPAVQNGERLP